MAPVLASAPAPRKRRGKADAGALTKAQRLVTPAEEAAFATIEAEMGGRSKLVATLATAHLDEATNLVLGAIADPQNDKDSLARICALHGVSPASLIKLFRSAVLARGQMIAIARIAEKVPDVAAAVMEDAIPGQRTCPKCLGATTIPKPTTDDPDATERCPTCYGLGSIQHEPDHDVQKTALQIAGLLEKGSGVKVTTLVANQNVQAGTDSGSYDKLIGALDSVIYGSGRDRMRRAPGGTETADEGEAIDAEILPSDQLGEAGV